MRLTIHVCHHYPDDKPPAEVQPAPIIPTVAVWLGSGGLDKLAVVKAIRARFSYTLQESANLFRNTPAYLGDRPLNEARSFAREMASAGGEVYFR
jgi:ribosomal protein L7/L12